MSTQQRISSTWGRVARSLGSFGRQMRATVTNVLTGLPGQLTREQEARIEEMEKDYQWFMAWSRFSQRKTL